jgi:hypothetical protein
LKAAKLLEFHDDSVSWNVILSTNLFRFQGVPTSKCNSAKRNDIAEPGRLIRSRPILSKTPAEMPFQRMPPTIKTRMSPRTSRERSVNSWRAEGGVPPPLLAGRSLLKSYSHAQQRYALYSHATRTVEDYSITACRRRVARRRFLSTGHAYKRRRTSRLAC